MFLLIVLAVIDFGNIITKKYALENDIDTITNMYLSDKNTESYLSKINAKMDIKKDNEFTTIILKKNVKVSSPLVNAIIGKNYTIEVSKSIYEKCTS